MLLDDIFPARTVEGFAVCGDDFFRDVDVRHRNRFGQIFTQECLETKEHSFFPASTTRFDVAVDAFGTSRILLPLTALVAVSIEDDVFCQFHDKLLIKCAQLYRRDFLLLYLIIAPLP